tara:strand:- start:282 stop:1184 length:903 start_codon:yes stop_codon:yes gene_type:complete
MNNVLALENNNYAAMAAAMGVAVEETTKKGNTLARLKINHSPIMGETSVNGKMMNVEVVSGGTYKLDIPDGPNIYSNTVVIRPFVQRFMYKRYIPNLSGDGTGPKGSYQKTIMADSLNVDLKDNFGDFNCGKPAGYIEDFNALPQEQKDLIRQIKRVRVIFGVVSLTNPVSETGDSVECEDTPFIWEVDNREAFKIVGQPMTRLAKMQRLPIQHRIHFDTEERTIPTGAVFYLPSTSLDVSDTVSLTESDQDMFADFMAWIQNYNDYIGSEWADKARKTMDAEDENIVDGFIDIESGDDN